MKHLRLIAGAAVVLAGLASSPAQAGLVLDLATGGSSNSCGAGSCGPNGTTFGYGFTVNTSFSIDGLGFWDAGADGLGTTVQTGLWDSGGTLLASVTVSDASQQVASASSDGNWRVEDIANLLLGPGDYRIGGVLFDTTPLAQVGAPAITISEITLGDGLFNDSNTGFQDPTQTFLVPVFGPTMRQVMAIPEPGSLVLVGAAVLGLLGVGGRNRRTVESPRRRLPGFP